ncbi:transglycosylase SLT domain-containing protein [Asticcacaulis sp. BYS171W]|uniref:Transglycosylase SLT domain-containing protein n=1 Tax=Asticcacaulis aquaticus TaxID=2984212 RepID=A0ABT5HV07_9CAUL|nr:transglycosylase SLT domain-containing protein [Asticcacaulis aquaticus]MDC7683884.1 transglycosylase SLT domain-containing protein [Asticcacaulis aquaticus]
MTSYASPYPSTDGVSSRKGGVVASITRAAQRTGVDFTYLLKTAQRESSLNPTARAPTSSAAGLFQFIEQTWLATIKQHGAKHGYANYADAIQQGKNGQYYVADAQTRRQVLGLRYDQDAAATMAAEMTAGNAAYLKGRTGRTPTAGQLYAAHFLGPAGAANLIKTAEQRPNASAAALFPAAAGANKSIFYRNGQPVTVTQLMANLDSKAGGSGEVQMPQTDDTGPYEGPEGFLVARAQRLQSDAQLLNMVFGGGAGEQSLLVATQLLSAFGPGKDDSADKDKSWFG